MKEFIVRFTKYASRGRIRIISGPIINKKPCDIIPDWVLGLVIAFVAIAMLTSPLWLCALSAGCKFA